MTITAIGVITKFRQSRGGVYLTRAQGLFTLHDELSARGPIAWETSASDADTAHSEFLSSIDLEARANAYLFVRSVGRLGRPGSFVTASGQLLYGIFLVALAVVQLLQAPASPESKLVSALTASAIFALAGILFCVFGGLRLARRIGTGRIRKRIGVQQSSARETLAQTLRGIRYLSGRLFLRWRQPQSKAGTAL